MSQKTHTLLTALDAIKAEREALREGKTGTITPDPASPAPPLAQPAATAPAGNAITETFTPSTSNSLNPASPPANPDQNQKQDQYQAPQPDQYHPPQPAAFQAPSTHKTTKSQNQDMWNPASRLNWQKAFYTVSIAGPLLGIIFGYFLLGGTPATSHGVNASATGGVVSGKAYKGGDKSNRLSGKTTRLTRADVMRSRRNCTELVLNSRTGRTTAQKCIVRIANKPHRSGGRPPPQPTTFTTPYPRAANSLAPKTLARPARPNIVPIKVKPVSVFRR